jgi:hypothetical protein
MQDAAECLRFTGTRTRTRARRVQREKTEAEAHECNLDRVPKVALDTFGR